MFKKKLQFVGLFRSVSKKGNEPFGIAYFTSEPDERIANKCVGVVGYKLFVGGDVLATLQSMRVGQYCDASLFNYKDANGEYTCRLLDLIPIK